MLLDGLRGNNFVCCIQWHPEAMLVASDDMLPVFTGLIEAAKKAADK